MSTDTHKLRQSIVDSMAPTRTKTTLGGQEVDIVQMTMRDVLSYEADDNSPETRVKSLATVIYPVGGAEPLFNKDDPEHIKMLLSIGHGPEISKIWDIINANQEDAEGN